MRLNRCNNASADTGTVQFKPKISSIPKNFDKLFKKIALRSRGAILLKEHIRRDIVPSRKSLRLHSVASKTESVVTSKAWWKQNAELWIDVHTEEDLRKLIDNADDNIVVVDFFATWCQGCERSYPELCRTASNSEFRKKVKFVKVCVDEMRTLVKAENIRALPAMSIYHPKQGRLLTLDVPLSKAKNLPRNLHTILSNPGMSFAVDPNGFVIARPRDTDAEEKSRLAAAEQAKQAEIEALNAMSRNLSKTLATTAGLQQSLATSPATPAPTAASAAAPLLTQTQNGLNGTAGTGAVPLSTTPLFIGASESTADERKYLTEKTAFLRKYGSQYGYGGRIDDMYHAEVGCRMGPREHYLDYTAASVYCQSQLQAAMQELCSSMFSNPHSASKSSQLTSERIEEIRSLVLRHFNASPAEYQVVFTRCATGALKLVGETFPWTPASMFRYLRENHNSVNGIREYALRAGAEFESVDEMLVEEWLHGDTAYDHSGSTSPEAGAEPAYSLFAYPAEDNFAGVKYPLSWVQRIKERSTESHQWLVLLDAAAYVPTQPLDLSAVPADFVDLSFYKMFGYPTGVGALIVRVEVVPMLKKVFWGGGSVALATSHDDFHVLKSRPSDRLEDGTINYLDIIALKHGFDMLTNLGGIPAVQAHTNAIREYLHRALTALHHSNGAPMVTVFGKHSIVGAEAVQGPIINFEALAPDGQVVNYKTVETEASEAGFHLRTGSECNPGACYNYLGAEEKDIETLAGKKECCGDDVVFVRVQRPVIGPRASLNKLEMMRHAASNALGLGHPGEVALQWVDVPLGSIRLSLGYMSTFEDAYAFVTWFEGAFKNRTL